MRVPTPSRLVASARELWTSYAMRLDRSAASEHDKGGAPRPWARGSSRSLPVVVSP